jgi:predicted house-cleaning noncanonical NTP pyrophosphatase (MazG superfamily)
MFYNKLIRDNIPDIIAAKGEKAIIHVADLSEYKKKLDEKLVEEVEEFLAGYEMAEMADIFEVLAAIDKINGYDLAQVEQLRQEKKKQRGGFERRIILEES